MDTKRLRQRVLDLAIHGKLVPQNPQDEPASELLKRIAAEKERLIKEGKIKKSKKKDNEDIDEVPFEVPQGWVWTNVETIATKITDGTHKTPRYTNKGIKFVSAKNLYSGKLSFNECKYISLEEHLQLYKRCNPEYNDILISKSGSIGTVTLNTVKFEFSLFESLALIKYNKDYILPEALKLAVQYACTKLTNDEVKGVGVTHLPIESIKKLQIPLPPLAEQHRIVSEVEKYFSLIDILEESENDLQQSIQKAKSKILDLAIKGKLVEKTGEWEEKKLGDIGKWQAGATPSRANKSYYGGNIPWLKTGDLNDGFITEIPEYITEKALEETSVKLNPEGSVLVAMYGATIGKVGILTFPATTNQACCACINCSIDKMYLFYFLLANKEYFIRLGGGGAQPNISKEKIVNTPISVPPLAEQHQIVAKIEEIFTQLDNIAEALK